MNTLKACKQADTNTKNREVVKSIWAELEEGQGKGKLKMGVCCRPPEEDIKEINQIRMAGKIT